MNKYKIIATDLDGTLLNSSQHISDENNAAMQILHDMGVHIVPSTGRALWEMPKEVRDHPLVRFIIHTDGATIYDKKTGKNINMPMNREESDKMFDIMERFEATTSVRYDGYCYSDINEHNMEFYTYNSMSETYAKHLFKYSKPVENFNEFCRNTLPEIDMICSFFHNEEERQEAFRIFDSLPEYQTACSVVNNIEVFSSKAGKGKSLAKLCDILGVDIADTIAIGDSTNDSEALEYAGLGLATDNAYPELKEIADEVICHCDEHIMQYILEHYYK